MRAIALQSKMIKQQKNIAMSVIAAKWSIAQYHQMISDVQIRCGFGE
jgi:hypothetical protein